MTENKEAKKTTAKSSITRKAVNKKAPIIFWTSGRRKTAVARIKMQEKGSGLFVVNEKETAVYFPAKLDCQLLQEPFETVGKEAKDFDISIKVHGGGKKAQLGACVLGLSKALLQINPDFRATLKKRGLLTRDPRMKERKKYGLKRARKAPQFSKR